jgi:penicillin-binding protein 1A
MPPGATQRMWAGSSETAPPPKKTTRSPRPGKPTGPTGPTGGRPPRRRWLTALKWGSILVISGLALGVATIAFVFWMYGRDPNLPDYNKLSDYHPKQLTTILDSNNQPIGVLGGERRTFVTYDKIPPRVVDAFVAAEDTKFWTHGGVDYWGMLRAFLKNLRAGGKKEGASTITQQVVKNLLLTPERTFKRKIQEIILARRLEKSLSKEEIMTLYLNEIYFGDGAYGIQEAAHLYFGKDVSQINVGEAAVLGALPKEPETLAHALRGGKNPERVKARQIYVLNQMVAIGKITPDEAKKWIDAPIKVVKDSGAGFATSAEWRDIVRKELFDDKNVVRTEVFPERAGATMDNLGARVRTTLDPSMQATAQRALQAGLRGVDKRQHIGRPLRSLKGDKVEGELARLAKRLPKGGPQAGEIYDAIVVAAYDADNEVEVDLGSWKAALVLGGDDDARFNPLDDEGKTKTPSERFKPGDVVEVTPSAADLAANAAAATGDEDSDKQKKPASGPKHARHRVLFPTPPQGAVVIIDIKTRKVRALVGGYSSKIAGLNRATQALRQPGSSFKPFVYATAIDSGKFTAASKINDAPEVFDLWKPKNYESGSFLGPVLLRKALAKSINTVAIRVTYDVKPETIAALAHKMGIGTKLPEEMSLALGSGEVTPLEMTNAIATLAAGGIAKAPRFIDAIDGKATADPRSEQVLRPEVAYVVTDMMRSVVTEGTGIRAAALKIPIAGKTGTSNDARDTWFIGLTPDYAIGVWLGYDKPRAMPGETGGTTAVPIYVEIMKSINPTAKPFTRPAHVVEATIDKATGLLAPEGAPKDTTMTEVFVEGTAPTEIAPLAGDVTPGNAVETEYKD